MFSAQRTTLLQAAGVPEVLGLHDVDGLVVDGVHGLEHQGLVLARLADEGDGLGEVPHVLPMLLGRPLPPRGVPSLLPSPSTSSPSGANLVADVLARVAHAASRAVLARAAAARARASLGLEAFVRAGQVVGGPVGGGGGGGGRVLLASGVPAVQVFALRGGERGLGHGLLLPLEGLSSGAGRAPDRHHPAMAASPVLDLLHVFVVRRRSFVVRNILTVPVRLLLPNAPAPEEVCGPGTASRRSPLSGAGTGLGVGEEESRLGAGASFLFALVGEEDEEPVDLQDEDERVLGGEEEVGVAQHLVAEDEQHAEHQERPVLQQHADHDRQHLDIKQLSRIAVRFFVVSGVVAFVVVVA